MKRIKLLEKLEETIKENRFMVSTFPDKFYYKIGSLYNVIRENDITIVSNFKQLEALSDSAHFYPFYKILYLSAYINKNNLREIDKCGSFYVDIRPCSEDCAFCPLSKDHYSKIDVKNIVWEKIPDEIYNYAKKIYNLGVRHFKTVTTGAKSDPRIIPFIAEGVKKVKCEYPDMTVCISEGTLDQHSLKMLKNAGVDIFNNNLESAREVFKKIVSTHSYDDKIEAIKKAKSLGFEICSGGIFGIGENIEDRIELFLTLRELDVDSSPFNIFVPFENLPLTKELKEKDVKFSKAELFYSIALYRLINPKKRLIIGAGREEFLTREEQKFALLIGASAIASSGYLSKEGLLYTSKDDDKMFSEILDDL